MSRLTRTLELFAFAVVPLAALAIGLSTFSDQNRIALDFHYELYPQAHAVVHGGDVYPAPESHATRPHPSAHRLARVPFWD